LSPESTPPTTGVKTSRTGRTRNVSSIIVLALILSVSIGSVFYMAYPSLQMLGTATETYASTGMLPYPVAGYGLNPITQTTFSTSCLYNDCFDYPYPTYPVYSITYTTTISVVGRITTQMSVEGTIYNYATSYWTQSLAPFAYLGSSENLLPTGILALALSLIAALLALYVKLHRKPAKDIETKASPSVRRNKFKFCRECGAQIPRDSVFCEECGTKLTG